MLYFLYFLSSIITSAGNYTWFLYRITKKKKILFVALIIIIHFTESFIILSSLFHFNFQVDFDQFGNYLLLLNALVSIISWIFLIKIFTSKNKTTYLNFIVVLIMTIVTFIIAVVCHLTSSHFNDYSKLFLPTISLLVCGVSLATITFLITTKLEKNNLVVLDKFIAILFILFTWGECLSYVFSDDFFMGSLLSIFSHITLLIFSYSLIKSVKTDCESKIENLQQKRTFFSHLTHRISKQILEEEKIEKVIKLINDSAIKITNASGSIIWMFSEKHNKYITKSVSGKYPPLYSCSANILKDPNKITRKLMSGKFETGETYAGHVAKTQMPIVLHNVIKNSNNLIPQTTNGVMDIESILCLPVILEKKVIGVMSVVNKVKPEKHFSFFDLSFMRALSEQLALAVSQFDLYRIRLEKKMHQRDLILAGNIQQSLLPKDFPNKNILSCYGFSLSALGLGGDYFDFIEYSKDKYGFIMSDVAGKGVSAALVMIMVRAIFMTAAKKKDSPKEIMTSINNILLKDTKDMFVTLFYYILDTKSKKILYTNAAHSPLLIYRIKLDEFEEMDTNGIPLGIRKELDYQEKTSKVSKGDILILYTDGISEAMNTKREQYKLDRLKNIIRLHKDESMSDLSKIIRADIDKFVGGADQHDDQALFLSKIL